VACKVPWHKVSEDQISTLMQAQAKISTAIKTEQWQLERIGFAIDKTTKMVRYAAVQRTLDERRREEEGEERGR